MKITREELRAIENHMSSIPAVAGMYTPVLIAWCRALLDDNADAYRRGAEAMREQCIGMACAQDLDLDAQDRMEERLRALPIPEEP